MKLLFLSAFAHIILSSALERYLEAPTLVKVVGLEPSGLQVIWKKVRYRAVDPVLGFKIKIWTVKTNTERSYEFINGDQYPTFVMHNKPTEIFSINKTIDYDAREIIIRDPAKTSHHILNGIQYNVLYEVRVLGFKRDVDGPMSLPIRVMIVKGSKYEAIVQRQGSGCLVSLPSFLQISDEIYPFFHDSYI